MNRIVMKKVGDEFRVIVTGPKGEIVTFAGDEFEAGEFYSEVRQIYEMGWRDHQEAVRILASNGPQLYGYVPRDQFEP